MQSYKVNSDIIKRPFYHLFKMVAGSEISYSTQVRIYFINISLIWQKPPVVLFVFCLHYMVYGLNSDHKDNDHKFSQGPVHGSKTSEIDCV